jgi:two-component system OmpR family response regulator/two-component system copper resistance phosphate regulon response regulator CusR
MDLLTTTNVVVVEDVGRSGGIASRFSAAGQSPRVVSSGGEAIALVQASGVDLAVVNLELADESALGVVRCIRELSPTAAILVVAGANQQQELLMALEAGADDFLISSADASELLLRSRVAVFRSRNRPDTKLEVGPLRFDLEKRRVTREGKEVALTPTELRILEILMKNRSLVVSRRMLCEFLWSPSWEGITNVIEVHINRLRRKVELPGQPRLIKTIRGRGYLIDA